VTTLGPTGGIAPESSIEYYRLLARAGAGIPMVGDFYPRVFGTTRVHVARLVEEMLQP
jgi:hypothetical protein